jgi:hypothetical protein
MSETTGDDLASWGEPKLKEIDDLEMKGLV